MNNLEKIKINPAGMYEIEVMDKDGNIKYNEHFKNAINGGVLQLMKTQSLFSSGIMSLVGASGSVNLDDRFSILNLIDDTGLNLPIDLSHQNGFTGGVVASSNVTVNPGVDAITYTASTGGRYSLTTARAEYNYTVQTPCRVSHVAIRKSSNNNREASGYSLGKITGSFINATMGSYYYDYVNKLLYVFSKPATTATPATTSTISIYRLDTIENTCRLLRVTPNQYSSLMLTPSGVGAAIYSAGSVSIDIFDSNGIVVNTISMGTYGFSSLNACMSAVVGTKSYTLESGSNSTLYIWDFDTNTVTTKTTAYSMNINQFIGHGITGDGYILAKGTSTTNLFVKLDDLLNDVSSPITFYITTGSTTYTILNGNLAINFGSFNTNEIGFRTYLIPGVTGSIAALPTPINLADGDIVRVVWYCKVDDTDMLPW